MVVWFASSALERSRRFASFFARRSDLRALFASAFVCVAVWALVEEKDGCCFFLDLDLELLGTDEGVEAVP